MIEKNNTQPNITTDDRGAQAVLTQNEQKKLAAYTALDVLVEKGVIFSGMKIGLGSGSTVIPAIERLAYYLDKGIITAIYAAATSFQTTILCERLNVKCYSMNAPRINGSLDLAIDGADEISPENYLIKGGGAALLREKIVAYNAKRFVIVADQTKAVPHLGTAFPLPIEIIPEARVCVSKRLQAEGAFVTLREGVKKAGPVITDNGNMILDVVWGSPRDAAYEENRINGVPGVVECGFFTQNPPIVFIARADGSVETRGI